MKLKVLGVVSAILLATPCAAQDNELGYERELGVHLRWTIIGGYVVDDEGWDAFFENSVGIGLQYTLFWKTSPEFEVGGYLGFSYDWFDGNESSINVEGTPIFISPDQLTVMRNTIGFTCRFNVGQLYLEPRVGIGIANYSAVDANLRGPGGTAKIEAIDPSIEFTVEIGLRAAFPLSNQLNFIFGVVYERNKPPAVGAGLDDGVSRFDPQENVSVDFGLKYNF